MSTVEKNEKKPRLSAEETRERLVVVGVQALFEKGLSVGLDAVSLERSVVDAEVPRSSAYAAWSGDEGYTPQEFFQQAVLMRAVEARRDTYDLLMEDITAFMEAPPEGLSRPELLRELIRISRTKNLQNVFGSRPWQIVFAVRTIMNTGDSPSLLDEELLAWMQTTEETLRNETIETLYKPMAKFFGLRPRPEYGDGAWHLLEVASSSLLEGLSMRFGLPASDYFHGIAHPETSDENWSILALLYDRLIHTFFEMIPDDEAESG